MSTAEIRMLRRTGGNTLIHGIRNGCIPMKIEVDPIEKVVENQLRFFGPCNGGQQLRTPLEAIEL